MKNRIILQVLALIAGALSVSPTARVELAQLGNRVAKFKKDHGLEGDEELTGALGAVLRAAEVAPVSADATTAQAQTAAHLEPSGEELDDQNAAAGASGNSGLGDGGAGSGDPNSEFVGTVGIGGVAIPRGLAGDSGAPSEAGGNQESGAGTSGAEGDPAGPKGTSGAEVTGETSDSGAPVNDAVGK